MSFCFSSQNLRRQKSIHRQKIPIIFPGGDVRPWAPYIFLLEVMSYYEFHFFLPPYNFLEKYPTDKNMLPKRMNSVDSRRVFSNSCSHILKLQAVIQQKIKRTEISIKKQNALIISGYILL